VLLRRAALIAVLAGACGSAGLTLYAGRHNESRFLVALFLTWVLSPSAALVAATVVSKRWSARARVTLHSLMLVLPLASVAIYADVALGRPRAKPAFAFLVVPLASWILLAVIVPIAGRLAPRAG
jgi:hypothetical protein